MSHFQGNSHMEYVTGDAHMGYGPATTSFPSYSTSYLSNNSHPQNLVYLPHVPTNVMQYQLRPPLRPTTLPSQRRPEPSTSSYSVVPAQRGTYLPLRHSHDVVAEAEDQETAGAGGDRSEPIEPPLEGYPSVERFDELMTEYVAQLSPKKQDKALINAKRACEIKQVLLDKKTTAVGSAQFRFWVKKMFTLMPNDGSVPTRSRKICHENKPVAVREKLFKILTKAHSKCQHGGRDKTSAQVRRMYSWVPKELISRFVKLCPTCKVRRGTSQVLAGEEDNKSPSSSPKTEDGYSLSTPTRSRRSSAATGSGSSVMHSPLPLGGTHPVYHSQNRWMSDLQCPVSAYTTMPTSAYQTSAPSQYSTMSAYGNMEPSYSNNMRMVSSSQSYSPDHRSLFKQEMHY